MGIAGGAAGRGPTEPMTRVVRSPDVRMSATEEQLLRQLHEGPGDEALRALYALHGEALYGFAVRRLGDRGLAEELVQDVFTRVSRHAGDFDPERASFRTWLYQIARNAAVDVERRRMVRPSLSSESAAEEPTEPDEPIERAVLRWQMEDALDPGAKARPRRCAFPCV